MIQQFELQELKLPGIYLITPFSASDHRGCMVKDYSIDFFLENSLQFEPIETLYISSNKFVLRGLHFQNTKPQSKLLRCIKGKVWCVAVDIRKDSNSIGKWISIELNDNNGKEILVPGEYAVGTLALEDSMLSCKCGERFYAEYDDGIRWNDADIDIKWPINNSYNKLCISDKDKELQSLQMYLKRG